MKYQVLFIAVISFLSLRVQAQQKHADTVKSNLSKDTLSNSLHPDSLLHKKKRLDSVVHRFTSKVSDRSNFQVSSLVNRLHKNDTIRTKPDTVKQENKASQLDPLPKRQSRIDSLVYKKQEAEKIAHRFNSKVDSLSTLSLSSLLRKRNQEDDGTKTGQDTMGVRNANRKQSIRSDSLKEAYTQSLNTVNNASDSIKQKVNTSITQVQKKLDAKTGFLDSLQLNVKNPVTDKSTNYGIDGIQTALPSKKVDIKDMSGNELKIPSATAPDLKLEKDLRTPVNNPLDKVGDQMNDLKQQPQRQLADNDLLKDAAKIKDKAKQVGEVSKKAETYQEDIKNIKEGGLEKAKALPEEAEKAAANLNGMKELQKETQKFEATKNVLQQYQDAVKEMNDKKLLEDGKELGQKQLTDHFAGKEEKLKAGAAQLDKLKKKYGNIPDSRYLPKRAPNPLNGKPLIERLIPGINLQVFEQRNLVNIDASPFVVYKISPRWRVGTGATYRFQFNKKVQLVEDHPAYGGRVMTNILIWGGLHFHLEGEVMKIVPYDFYTQSYNTEEGKKWIPGLHGGIMKHYKISKKINGNFQVLYNFLYHRNGLYPNKVNMRFGFEFPMKKKVRNLSVKG